MGFNNLNNYNTIFYPCSFGVGWGTSQSFTVDCNRTQCTFFFFFALLSMKQLNFQLSEAATKISCTLTTYPLTVPLPISSISRYTTLKCTYRQTRHKPSSFSCLGYYIYYPPVNSHPFG